MSERIATYSCLSTPGVSQVAKMKPDENGYWKMILGGFNVSNESGIHYIFNEAVKTLMEKTGLVARRIEKGLLFSEYGHPNLTGLQHHECLQRLALIEPTRVCSHIKKIWMDKLRDENGQEVVVVYGLVKPSGPYAETLERSLANPEENVAYSVRTFCQSTIYRGKIAKIVTDVLTYDYVTEPGIRMANQFKGLSLEHLALSTLGRDIQFTEEDFNIKSTELITMESEMIQNIRMIRDNQGWHRVSVNEGITSSHW